MNQILSQHQIVDKKENKTTTAKKEKDRREGKGRVLAISRNVFYLLDSKDVYYVQSQHSSEIYYYVKYNADVFEWCSCLDNSTRHIKCKHIFAIEFAIKWGTIKDIDKVPSEPITIISTDVKSDTPIMKTISSVSNTTTTNEKEGNYFLPLKNMSSSSRAKVAIQQQSKSYLEDDDYDF